MGKWLKRTNVVAILVAGTGAVHQFVFMHPAAGWPKWEKQMMGSCKRLAERRAKRGVEEEGGMCLFTTF